MNKGNTKGTYWSPRYWTMFLGLLLLSLMVVGGAGVMPVAQGAPPTPQGDNVAMLLERAQQEGSVRVIAILQLDVQPEMNLSSGEIARQQQSIAQTSSRVRDHLASYEEAGRLTLHRSYETLPALALSVDAEALQALSQLPEVRAIVEDLQFAPALDTSIPVIGADTVWNEGYTGVGYRVAVLDTGVERTHPFLSGKIVAEACYSSNQGTTVSDSYTRSVCPGGSETVIGTGSAAPCSADGCDHGTHVAGIAAGHRYTGMAIPFDGVAKDASIIAVQVFSAKYSKTECEAAGRSSPCTTAFFSDIIKGMEYVYGLRTTYAIAALNMSISGYQYFDPTSCDEGAWGQLFKTAAANLVGANIAVVAAAGNNSFTNSLAMPACVSNIISVGATNDNDTVASFSNSAWFLDILAPGTMIDAPIPGSDYEYKNGTSMAAPHVVGAWAILRQAEPDGTVQEILTVLKNTGASITDQRNGITSPRIQLNAALAALRPISYGLDVTPPDPDSLSHLQGKTVRYSFKVANTGNVPATYRVTLSGQQWPTRLSVSEMVLEKGASRTVEVAVDIPANAADGEYDTVTVTAMVVEDTTKQGSFALRTTSQGPPPPGDCNGDGAIDSNDFHAMMHGIFRGSYNTSCDANQDSQVNAADFSCTFLLINGGVCSLGATTTTTDSFPIGANTVPTILHLEDSVIPVPVLPVSIAATTAPQITIAQNIPSNAGDTVAVPLMVTGGDVAIASLSFSLTYDELLLFDPTDSDRNGIPEAIQFNLPAGWRTTVTHDATNRTINLVAFSTAAPRTSLPNGRMMTVSFFAGFPPTPQSFPISFSSPTVQDAEGTAHTLLTSNGSVLITPQALSVPILDIANTIPANGGEMISIPITFVGGNAQVTAIAFSINYDESLLSFDPIATIQDGIPDALNFNLPAGWTPLVLFDAADTKGEIDVVVFNERMPVAMLSGSTLLTVQLRVGNPSKSTGAMVSFSSNPSATFGNQFGQSVTGKTGGGVVAVSVAQTMAPKLDVAQGIVTIPGKLVEVPITFTANGASIAAITFSLDIDPTVLTYNAMGTTVSLPPGWQHEITYNQADSDGELDIAIFSRANPLSSLTDGEVMRLLFAVDEEERTGTSSIPFSSNPSPSFGDTQGMDIAGLTQSGSIRISSGTIYLPLVLKQGGLSVAGYRLATPAVGVVVLQEQGSVAQVGKQTLYLPIILKHGAVANPTPTPTAIVVPTPTPIVTGFAAQVIALTNQERIANGCPALTANALLTEAAYKHSEDMALNDYFSHNGLDGSSPGDRIARTGYQFTTWAENIAAGYSTPELVVEGWMNSEGHRQNILNCSLTEIGIGYYYLENDTGSFNYRRYWTQVFGIPRVEPSPSPTETNLPTPSPTATETGVPEPTATETGVPEPTATETAIVFPTPSPTETTVPSPDNFATQVIALTNQERIANGCPALTANALLTEAAYKHSEDMALNDYFSHTGLDGSLPGDRIARTGYQFTTWAENIAAGYSTPELVVEGWMNSEGHRQNILNCSLTEIGIGYYYLENDTGSFNYRRYWTQVFGIPRVEPSPSPTETNLPTPSPTATETGVPEPTATETGVPEPTATETAIVFPTPSPTETTVPDSWLGYVNSIRAISNLSAVTENTTWSNGCWLHSRYMVKNDVISHSEDTANEWYSQEGYDAAKNGNVAVTSSTNYRYQDPIDMWITGPFHAIGILDPRLTQVGFGLYTEAIGQWQGGATLDVLRGLGSIPDGTTFPIMFPGDGKIMPYTRYEGYEWPDPITSCPGYSAPSGPPILIQFSATPNVSNYRFMKDGQDLETCMFDESSYVNSDAGTQSTGRSVLKMRHTVVLMPRNPLTAGTYTVSVTENGTDHTWSFFVTGSLQAMQTVGGKQQIGNRF